MLSLTCYLTYWTLSGRIYKQNMIINTIGLWNLQRDNTLTVQLLSESIIVYVSLPLLIIFRLNSITVSLFCRLLVLRLTLSLLLTSNKDPRFILWRLRSTLSYLSLIFIPVWKSVKTKVLVGQQVSFIIFKRMTYLGNISFIYYIILHDWVLLFRDWIKPDILDLTEFLLPSIISDGRMRRVLLYIERISCCFP